METMHHKEDVTVDRCQEVMLALSEYVLNNNLKRP